MSANVSTIEAQKSSPSLVSNDEDVLYSSTDPNALPQDDNHFTLVANLVLSLRNFFADRADANVFGGIMFYYKQESRKHFVTPDVTVCFGIDKNPRRIYKLWEETTPAVVIEIASGLTWEDDLQKKFDLYEFLDVGEYYVFDSTYEYMPVSFAAYRLVNKEFVSAEIKDGRIFSEALGLELVDTGETLRFFNPKTNEFLMTMEEMAAELARLKAEK